MTDKLLAGRDGFTHKSSYFDIFDNLLSKRVTDLNLRNQLERLLKVELGKVSEFQYKKLSDIEQRVEDAHKLAMAEDSMTSVIVLNDRSADTQIAEKNKQVLQGKYEFKFPQ